MALTAGTHHLATVTADLDPLDWLLRIDHLALRAETANVILTVPERIYEAGAGNGQVTDLGPLSSVGFVDPDGMWARAALPPTA